MKTYKFKIGQQSCMIAFMIALMTIDCFKVYHKVWCDSSAYSHFGKYRHMYNNIMTITFEKCKMHRSLADDGPDEIYSVIYMILMRHTRNAEVIGNTICKSYRRNKAINMQKSNWSNCKLFMTRKCMHYDPVVNLHENSQTFLHRVPVCITIRYVLNSDPIHMPLAITSSIVSTLISLRLTSQPQSICRKCKIQTVSLT